jgi:hypothetical protein
MDAVFQWVPGYRRQERESDFSPPPDPEINPLTPELYPSTQRCLTRSFTGGFASWTVRFVNICVKNQHIHQLFIQFINYVW